MVPNILSSNNITTFKKIENINQVIIDLLRFLKKKIYYSKKNIKF